MSTYIGENQDAFEYADPMITPPDVEDISPEDLSKITVPQMLSWFVCLYVPKVQKQTAGGIIIPDSTIDNQQHMTITGKVLDMGPKAFTDPRLRIEGDEDLIPKVGDWVLIGQYSGTRIRTREGVTLRLVTDSNIYCKISDPGAYVSFV